LICAKLPIFGATFAPSVRMPQWWIQISHPPAHLLTGYIFNQVKILHKSTLILRKIPKNFLQRARPLSQTLLPTFLPHIFQNSGSAI